MAVRRPRFRRRRGLAVAHSAADNSWRFVQTCAETVWQDSGFKRNLRSELGRIPNFLGRQPRLSLQLMISGLRLFSKRHSTASKAPASAFDRRHPVCPKKYGTRPANWLSNVFAGDNGNPLAPCCFSILR